MSSCVAFRMSTLRLICRLQGSSGIWILFEPTKKKAELCSAGQVGHLPLRGFYWVLVTGYWLLVVGVFLGQLHLGGFQFLLHPGHVGLIYFCGHRPVPLGEGPLPVRRRQFEASGLLV